MFLSMLFILSTGWSTSWAAEHKTIADFTVHECQKNFIELAKSKSWDQENYRQHVSGPYQQTVYRNLSKTLGQWIDVKFKEKAPPEIYQLNNTTIIHYSFNSSCEVITKNESWPWHLERVFLKKMDEDWTNEDLNKLVSSGKKGMIYYWSPRFSYSVYDLPRMEKLAAGLGYEFTALADPRASKEEILGALEVMRKKTKPLHYANRQLASKQQFSRNISTDLYMRNGFNHFPTTYIYNKQKIHSRWIVGLMTDAGLKNMADTFSNELAGK